MITTTETGVIMLVLIVIFVCLTWLALGILFSVPFTYGTAREFWKRRNDTMAYHSLFGRLHILVIILSGPMLGLLMGLSAMQLRSPFGWAWPSRRDWECATRQELSTQMYGETGVTIRASAAR